MIFDNLFEGESRGESLLFNFLFLQCVGVFLVQVALVIRQTSEVLQS